MDILLPAFICPCDGAKGNAKIASPKGYRFFLNWTVANTEVKMTINSDCFKNKLLVALEENKTLLDNAYEEAVIKLAESLVSLMLKLGKKTIKGKSPEIC